ncbi:hypothetical protein D5400_05500 [Georhizobium profundi]|jgi:hypothetical protein|uniref:DUF6460 domain-containing protein n=1 Tax=Georhizobium profundi TaxID=2341112 RepID=A0A3Q8XML3_9HYPH|nr:DUF6460 domain-containing protein [Georhizobium profundi]AZN70800.1 hypothetical protein D5400_05500 [Georhizobium profundi]GLQ36676.1 hypothetical protein GCM10007908_02960 [Rhizobium albus]
MSGRVTRFLGDTPGRTLVKLLVVSFIVGVVMNVMGWYPLDIYYFVRDFALYLWDLGFDAFGSVGNYLILGAMVVIPVFLILRIVSYRN